MATFRNIAAPLRYEIDKIKGSRFIADALPLPGEAHVAELVEAVRAELPDARHYCWAWRLGRGPDHFRYTDDGEPSGTAGRPILRQIDGHGLTDVLVVVTRYFGGTKLGTGGLTRAYGGAAAAVLDRADLVVRTVTRRLRIEHAYELTGAVQGVLAAHELEPAAQDYGAEVTLALDVPEELADAVAAELMERTAGRARVVVAPRAEATGG